MSLAAASGGAIASLSLSTSFSPAAKDSNALLLPSPPNPHCHRRWLTQDAAARAAISAASNVSRGHSSFVIRCQQPFSPSEPVAASYGFPYPARGLGLSSKQQNGGSGILGIGPGIGKQAKTSGGVGKNSRCPPSLVQCGAAENSCPPDAQGIPSDWRLGLAAEEDRVLSNGDAPETHSSYEGKSGFVSFHPSSGLQLEGGTQQVCHQEEQQRTSTPIPAGSRGWKSLLWLLGPSTLVASVVLPPLYLRRVSEALLQDSLLTDFVILFFTESCFYVGALVFLFLADKFNRELLPRFRASENVSSSYEPLGYQVSAYVCLTLGILLPIATLSVVWSWTGPAAAAALVPYILGVIVQLSFEQITRASKSPVYPAVPVIFQIYRLHQLNRAAQLVAGLLFSLRGAETTAETLAINGSLRTLLSVLQLLGILALWSLASFLSYGFLSWSCKYWNYALSSE